MKDFFEWVGRVVGVVALVVVVALVRGALAPKPVVFTPTQLDAYRSVPTTPPRPEPSWTQKSLDMQRERERLDAVQKALDKLDAEKWTRGTPVPSENTRGK